MGGLGNRRVILDLGWILAWGLASTAWCVTASQELSATFDEPLYVARGLEGWRSGSHSGLIRLGTMPLPIDVQTLPLYLWERWHGVTLDPQTGLASMLNWARLGTLPFWWLLLMYGWLAGRQIAGPWGGRLAVAWLACEPNLLAHASLATTDIAISACLLATLYHFQRGRGQNWGWRVAVPGAWLGVALLAKASALVFAPLGMLAIELACLFQQRKSAAAASPDGQARGGWFRRARELHVALGPFRKDLRQMAGIGLLVMLVYCGTDGRPEPSFVAWAHKLPDGAWGQSMVWISEHLTIFSNGLEGLVRQIKHNVRGHHGAFLLGTTHARSVWYYFPLALAIKLTAPALGLPWLLAGISRKSLFNWPCLVAAALLLFSVTCRVQIGIRLVLPLVVVLLVGLSAAWVQTVTLASGAWRRRLLAGGGAAAVAWTAWSAAHVWPHGLSYTNELWGGTSQGYLCLSDSNYDWGQGVKELEQWRRRQGLPELDVWYFGSDPAVGEGPLRMVKLHVLPLAGPTDVTRFVPGRYLAASTTMVYGTSTRDAVVAHGRAADFLRHQTPVARTTTFLIYDLAPTKEELAKQAAPMGDAQPWR